jgi:DNA repair protein RadD
MTEVLRPYQVEVIAKFWRAVEAGQRRIIIVAPTASGKTVIARAIVEQARSKASGSLFLAHRREILSQTSNKLRGIPHGVIRPGDQPRPLESVQVASVQTLHRRAIKGGTMELPEAGLVIVDECHHVVAQSYRSIIERYPDSILLGLTATPCRGDGRGLGSIFQTMIKCPQVGELVALDFLVPTRVYAPVDPDLHGVHVRRGDYVESELADRMDRPKLVGDIITNWVKYGERRKTVCFATSVRHSIHIRDEFVTCGVRAEHIDGSTPMDERDATLARLASGEIEVITICMCADRGLGYAGARLPDPGAADQADGPLPPDDRPRTPPRTAQVQLHRHRSFRCHLPARLRRRFHRVDARSGPLRREPDPCRTGWRQLWGTQDPGMPGVRCRSRRRDGLSQLRLSAGAIATRH